MSEQENHGTVLVVEGQHDTRQMMKWALEQHGYDVLVAETGDEAVEISEREHPDLILMDLHFLPGLDGLEAVGRIRQHEGIGEVPIIGVSPLDSAELQAEALAAGCTAFRGQPVDFDDFGDMADLILNHRIKKASKENGGNK